MNILNDDLAKSAVLLPKGFEDLLPGDADAEADAINAVMAVFKEAGYARVKPPLMEFEETMLGAGPGKALSEQTFRVMDKETGKMLALRSDITPQIARIASVLKRASLGEADVPLRLSYANDVVRMGADQQRTLRQFCQVGCELIHDGGDDDILEVVSLAAKGLKALNISGVSFDFALPCIFNDVLAAAGVEADAIDPLRAKISGAADKALDALKNLDLSEHAKGHVEQLERVLASDVLRGIEDVQFTIDPLETRGFEYHKGIAFTIFAQGVNGELGRGGAYELGDTLASGFTFYMDTVRKSF